MDLGVPAHELRPEFSLMMGQCFNWRRNVDEGVKEEEGGGVVEASAAAAVAVKEGGGEGEEEDKVWVGVLGRYVLEVRQTPTTTLVRRVVVAGDGGGVVVKKEEKGEEEEEEGEEGEEEVLLARLRDYFRVGVSVVGGRERGRRGGGRGWSAMSLWFHPFPSSSLSTDAACPFLCRMGPRRRADEDRDGVPARRAGSKVRT